MIRFIAFLLIGDALISLTYAHLSPTVDRYLVLFSLSSPLPDSFFRSKKGHINKHGKVLFGCFSPHLGARIDFIARVL